VFYTKGYDFYDLNCCTDCKLANNYYRNNYCAIGKYIINQSIHISYSFRISTLNKQPGLLRVTIVGSKREKRADSILYDLIDYSRAYFYGVNYTFQFSNDTITFTTNYQGREIKLLIY
jgi:hypothetical protein